MGTGGKRETTTRQDSDQVAVYCFHTLALMFNGGERLTDIQHDVILTRQLKQDTCGWHTEIWHAN